MKKRLVWLGVMVSVVAYSYAVFAAQNYTLKHAEPEVAAAVSTQQSESRYTVTSSTLTNILNKTREELGRGQIVEDSRLNKIAQMRAEDMHKQQYYAHTSPNGLLFTDYFSSVGIDDIPSSCENLLLSEAIDSTQVIHEWLQSESHKECLLREDVSRVGVAKVAFDTELQLQLYVTVFSRSL